VNEGSYRTVSIIEVSAVSVQVIDMKNSGPESSEDRVLLNTNIGDIIIELFEYLPITSGNFGNLTSARS